MFNCFGKCLYICLILVRYGVNKEKGDDWMLEELWYLVVDVGGINLKYVLINCSG